MDSKVPMPVSMGAHPYFNITSSKERGLSSHAVRAYKVDGLGLKGPMIDSYSRKVAFDDSLFHSAILEGTPPLIACLDLNGLTVTVKNTYSSILVLWTDGSGNFFCVEPWMDVPDAIHKSKNLVPIDHNKQYRWGFEISWS